LDHRWFGCYAPNQAPFMPSMLPLDRKVIYNGSGCNCLLFKIVRPSEPAYHRHCIFSMLCSALMQIS
jgi:hypothetical protein